MEFCDAAGLRTLLAANARCAQRAMTLRIVPSKAVVRVIDLAGMRAGLSVYPDRRRALAGAAGLDRAR